MFEVGPGILSEVCGAARAVAHYACGNHIGSLRASMGRWDVVFFADSFGAELDQPRALAAAMRVTAAGGLVVVADARGRIMQALSGEPNRLPDPMVIHAICLAHGFRLTAPLVDGEVIEEEDVGAHGDGSSPYFLQLGVPSPQNLTGEYDWVGEFWVSSRGTDIALPGPEAPQVLPSMDVDAWFSGAAAGALGYWPQESFEEYKELPQPLYLEGVCSVSVQEGLHGVIFLSMCGDAMEEGGAVYFGWARMQQGNRRRSHKIIVWNWSREEAYVHLVHAPGDRAPGLVRAVVLAQLRPGMGPVELSHDAHGVESTILSCRNALDSAHLACHEDEPYLFGEDL